MMLVCIYIVCVEVCSCTHLSSLIHFMTSKCFDRLFNLRHDRCYEFSVENERAKRGVSPKGPLLRNARYTPRVKSLRSQNVRKQVLRQTSQVFQLRFTTPHGTVDAGSQVIERGLL